MEIFFNSEKKFIGSKVIQFLDENITNEEVKIILGKLASGRYKKLTYKEANALLECILTAIVIDEGEEEIPISEGVGKTSSQADEPAQDDLDETIQGSTSGASGSGTDKPDPAPNPKQDSSKTRETCRFYARGHCNRKGDCRFEHPSICKQFRQFGGKVTDPKGCDGKCGSFHPNACNSSLKNKTCTWTECRFFHIKGTKTINREKNGVSSQNWRSNQNQNRGEQNRSRANSNQNSNQNQQRHNSDSKNRPVGLNQKNKKKRTSSNQSQSQNQNPSRDSKVETVTQEEKKQLGQTLEAIMKRLDAMESRPTYYPHPGVPMQAQVQPLLSPAVPQPGTQTQYQWGSPNPWTQSQQ